MESQVNGTTIVLIPKKANAAHLKKFRPIGLCNFQYKIISKILVKRLRPLLPSLVSDNQGAFLPGKGLQTISS